MTDDPNPEIPGSEPVEEPKRNIIVDEITEPVDTTEEQGTQFIYAIFTKCDNGWTVWACEKTMEAARLSAKGIAVDTIRRILIAPIDTTMVGKKKKKDPQKNDLTQDELTKMFIRICGDLWYSLQDHKHGSGQSCKFCQILGAIHATMALADIKGFETNDKTLAYPNQVTKANKTTPPMAPETGMVADNYNEINVVEATEKAYTGKKKYKGS